MGFASGARHGVKRPPSSIAPCTTWPLLTCCCSPGWRLWDHFRPSRALARIEKTCGARLVHRSTHALALTPEGETFLHYCQHIAGSLEELEGAFTHQSGEVRGLVRVELVVSDQLADIAREGIDIAIRTGTRMPDTVVARRIGTLARALYAAPAYLARHGWWATRWCRPASWCRCYPPTWGRRRCRSSR